MCMEATNKVGISLSEKKVYIVLRIETNCIDEINEVFDKVFSNKENAWNYVHQMILCCSPYFYKIKECEVE